MGSFLFLFIYLFIFGVSFHLGNLGNRKIIFLNLLLFGIFFGWVWERVG